jgi:CheY-like chemotaxis protein
VNAIRKDLVRRKDSETTGQRWRVETGRPLYRTRRLRLNRSSAFDLLMRPLITLKMWLIVKEQVQACPRQRAPNLLLIEDHADLANATAEFLRLLGLDIQIAGSGNQALKMARAFRPAIVLCDLSLPDMSGIEVLRRLRADPKTRHALFAVCTATDIDEFEEDFASEVDLFLSKPITNGDVNS